MNDSFRLAVVHRQTTDGKLRKNPCVGDEENPCENGYDFSIVTVKFLRRLKKNSNDGVGKAKKAMKNEFVQVEAQVQERISTEEGEE